MRIIKDIDIGKFEAAGQALITLEKVKVENKLLELEKALTTAYPDGVTENKLNEVLTDLDYIYGLVGITGKAELEKQLRIEQAELKELEEDLEETLWEGDDELAEYIKDDISYTLTKIGEIQEQLENF